MISQHYGVVCADKFNHSFVKVALTDLNKLFQHLVYTFSYVAKRRSRALWLITFLPNISFYLFFTRKRRVNYCYFDACHYKKKFVYFTFTSKFSAMYLFQVIFHKPVSITDHPKINEWLTLVEKEMRNSLARYLAQSVQDCATFLQDKIDTTVFNKWLDAYQVF